MTVILTKNLRLSCGVLRSLSTTGRRYSAQASSQIPERKRKYVPSEGTYPKGFAVAGVHVGIKPSNTTTPDLALITSKSKCSAAAVFTTNKFCAAPVQVSKKVLAQGYDQSIHAIVVNSGCANAVTGDRGRQDAERMVQTVDSQLLPTGHANGRSTLVMSTGVIGQHLPIQKILDGIPRAIESLTSEHEAWLNTAQAICTTDTFPKLMSITFALPSSPNISYSLAGMTKGAGMIHPNMATLLGIICTDAPVSTPVLQETLTVAMENSFNAISVDGDTSTNDTVALLANGAGGGPAITSLSSEDALVFQDVLSSFAQRLSHLVVRDGEGATKFVHIKVINSESKGDAKKIASTIARSPLVKTALYGKDANWGRILCALGYAQDVAPEVVVPEKVSVSFVPTDASPVLSLLQNGEPQVVDEARASEILAAEDLEIVVDLGGGKSGSGHEEAHYWTCDFSHEYITINGDYRT